VLWRRAKRRGPLVLLLHGHGVDERDIFPLEHVFAAETTVAALRGPIASEGGYRWYAHHDVGRPIAASLADGMAYVDAWLAAQGPAGVWLVGFSGGALIAGALLLSAPQRFAGVAMLHGPLPFDAGVPLEPGRLSGCEVFYGYGESDTVVPPALTARSRTYLREESGARAEIHGYRAGHQLVLAEERDLARWYAALT
jgi:phospholipase/carboxylesterase